MKLDLHVHTNYSIDSIIKPKMLAAKAQKLGIVFASTDHNTIGAHKDFRALKSKFIAGEEISTDRGDLIGLYLNEAIPRKTSFLESLDLIHGQGGLAYLPHMYDKTRKGVIPTKEEIPKLDIIEIYNSRALNPKYNEQAKQFADSSGLPGAVGTDSHYLFEFGSSYVEVPDFDISQPKALLKAVSNAKSVTKRAPFYVRGSTSLIAMGKKLFKKTGFY